ncbi:nucleoside deaminase [Marinigracilibium pacificum]|uniref:Nucleoside deaminase n=1 Tax=Marinigracilibium pacificum TaxID=2729599 RepID=A0A848J2B0_9BACT|nr:nucleoside deaminase [Marinigracilibium pacificum]NMM48449.1 nucleoside deaminase [Marinigracilibium pacificum]
MITHDDNFWMKMAIDIARDSRSPFGAVLVDCEGQQIAMPNTTLLDGPTAHAEMNVIRRMNELDYDDPEDLTLYTTVEPCPMCMGAIIWAGIGTLIYGASIKHASKFTNQILVSSEEIVNNSNSMLITHGGFMAEECEKLFQHK